MLRHVYAPVILMLLSCKSTPNSTEESLIKNSEKFSCKNVSDELPQLKFTEWKNKKIHFKNMLRNDLDRIFLIFPNMAKFEFLEIQNNGCNFTFSKFKIIQEDSDVPISRKKLRGGKSYREGKFEFTYENTPSSLEIPVNLAFEDTHGFVMKKMLDAASAEVLPEIKISFPKFSENREKQSEFREVFKKTLPGINGCPLLVPKDYVAQQRSRAMLGQVFPIIRESAFKAFHVDDSFVITANESNKSKRAWKISLHEIERSSQNNSSDNLTIEEIEEFTLDNTQKILFGQHAYDKKQKMCYLNFRVEKCLYSLEADCFGWATNFGLELEGTIEL